MRLLTVLNNRPDSVDSGFSRTFSALLVNSDDFDLHNNITKQPTNILPTHPTALGLYPIPMNQQ